MKMALPIGWLLVALSASASAMVVQRPPGPLGAAQSSPFGSFNLAGQSAAAPSLPSGPAQYSSARSSPFGPAQSGSAASSRFGPVHPASAASSRFGPVQPASAPSSPYGNPSAMEPVCTPYFEDVKVKRCVKYNDRVCSTTHKESCVDVEDQNCRTIVSSKQERKCFDVEDLVCSLKENVDYDTIQAVFTVQKCHRVNERVCDTIHEAKSKLVDDYQCIDMPSPKCVASKDNIVDKTCSTTTKFDCDAAVAPPAPPAPPQDAGSYNHYGSGFGQLDRPSSGRGQRSFRVGAYGSAPQQRAPEPQCKRTVQTKCRTIPRGIPQKECKPSSEKVCQKLSEEVPFAESREVCRDAEKKVCELEQRSQPKQIKKYSYTKECRTSPKNVCSNADVKELMHKCVPITRKKCTYTPVDNCEDLPKQHCYEVVNRIGKERCESPQQAEPTGFGGVAARQVVSNDFFGGGPSPNFAGEAIAGDSNRNFGEGFARNLDAGAHGGGSASNFGADSTSNLDARAFGVGSTGNLDAGAFTDQVDAMDNLDDRGDRPSDTVGQRSNY